MAGGADGRKPARTIQIPEGLLPHIPHHTIMTQCTNWKAESKGCEIMAQWSRAPQFRGAVPRRLTGFYLYGTGSQADAAVRIINKWIESARTKSTHTSQWAKMKAFDLNKWYYDEVSQLEDERRQRFKRAPPEEPLPFEVIVPWPEEYLNPGINRTPRDAFGNKLELLDPIRVSDEVFITLHSSRPWQIKIQGYEAVHVEQAEAHYRNKVRSIRNKLIGGSTPTNIILDETEGLKVVLRQSENWWPYPPQIVPRLITTLLDSGGFRNRQVNLEQAEEEIRCALDAIRYQSGSYDLSVRFGCLSVAFKTVPKDVEVPLSHFRNLIQGSVDCNTWKWLGEAELGDKLLERLMNAEHFLEPSKARGGFHGSRAKSLKQTRPTFKACYVVEDPNYPVRRNPQPVLRNPGRPLARGAKNQTVNDDAKPESVSHIVIQIEWTEDEEGYYEKMAPTYYRLKPGIQAPLEKMDVNLLELTESKAWHFGLDAMTLMPRSTVPTAVSDLAKSIDLKPGYSQNWKSRARLVATPKSSLIVTTLLERLYTFTIKDTSYQVELAHKWYHGRNSPLCGLAVRHTEWPTHLSLLEALASGCGAEWGDDVIKLFFPKNGISSAEDNTPGDGEGLRLLVKKLMELSKIVQSASTTTSYAASQFPVQQPTLGSRLASLNLIDIEE